MKDELTFSPVPTFTPLIRRSLTAMDPRHELAQSKRSETQIQILTQAVQELQQEVTALREAAKTPQLPSAADTEGEKKPTAKGKGNTNA